MSNDPRYTIPAGTKVEISDLATGDASRVHITRKTLRFTEATNTGYDGQIYYFTYRTWLIAVNSVNVRLH